MKQTKNRPLTKQKFDMSQNSGIHKKGLKAKSETATRKRSLEGRPLHTMSGNQLRKWVGERVSTATELPRAQARPCYPPHTRRSGMTVDTQVTPFDSGEVEHLRGAAGPSVCVTPVRPSPALEHPLPGCADSSEGVFETGGNGMIMAIKLNSSSPSQARTMTFEEAVPRANLSILPPDITYSSFRKRWLRRVRGSRTKHWRRYNFVSPSIGKSMSGCVVGNVVRGPTRRP